MTIGDGNFDIRDLMLGFEAAIERFKAEGAPGLAKDLASRRRAKMALFEALAWAASIEQLIRDGAGDRGGTPGWHEDLDLSDANLVDAFIYARGAVHHQWWGAIALHVRPSTEYSEQQNTWLWADLPANANARGGKAAAGRAAYDAVLHKRPVIEAIDALHRVFQEQIRPSELRERLYLNVP